VKTISLALGLALAGLAVSAPAQAADFSFRGPEVGLGLVHFDPEPDGIWRQEGLPHTMDLRSPVVTLGVYSDAYPWLRWHAGAAYLGTTSVDSWDTVRDADYSTTTKQCLRNCDNLIHVLGKGSAWGVYTTLEAHTTGTVQWGFEAGPLLYRAHWKVQVPGFLAAVNLPPDATPQQVAPWGLMPGGIQRDLAKWGLGAVLGVSVSYNDWVLSVRRYLDGPHWPVTHQDGSYDGFPALWRTQTSITVGKRF
jgi:hypothetical protein